MVSRVVTGAIGVVIFAAGVWAMKDPALRMRTFFKSNPAFVPHDEEAQAVVRRAGIMVMIFAAVVVLLVWTKDFPRNH